MQTTVPPGVCRFCLTPESAGLMPYAIASTSEIDATGIILDQSSNSAAPEAQMLQKRSSQHPIIILQPSALQLGQREDCLMSEPALVSMERGRE